MAAPPCSRPTRTLSQGLREPHVLRIPTHSSAGLKGKANPSCSSYAMYFCRPGSEALSLFSLSPSMALGHSQWPLAEGGRAKHAHTGTQLLPGVTRSLASHANGGGERRACPGPRAFGWD